MKSLEEKFLMPLPKWLRNIEVESYHRICNAKFAKDCKGGDALALKKEFLGLWPFVDKFPEMVINGCWGVLKPRLLWQYGIRDLLNLHQHSRRALLSISTDEKTHRMLWLESCDVLGLKFPSDFYRDTLPAVQGWIDAVNQTKDPFKMFVGFVAVEIIAESISVNMLESQALKNTMSNRGIKWFQVHIASDHAAMTHEQLAWRLAFALHSSIPTETECNAVVQNIISCFLSAGQACDSLDIS